MLQGVKVHAFADFEKLGASKPSDATPPKPEDPACIMYTSGTTGASRTLELGRGRLELGPVMLQGDRQMLYHCAADAHPSGVRGAPLRAISCYHVARIFESVIVVPGADVNVLAPS